MGKDKGLKGGWWLHQELESGKPGCKFSVNWEGQFNLPEAQFLQQAASEVSGT